MLSVVIVTTTKVPTKDIPKETRMIHTPIPQDNDGAMKKAENVFLDLMAFISGYEKQATIITMFIPLSSYDFGVYLYLCRKLDWNFRLVVVTEGEYVDLSEFSGLGELKEYLHVGVVKFGKEKNTFQG